ncbi:hypothetical protein QE152_g22019 [Popillia japonica]|uniref:HCLS1-associated protein X-1 n=1 Tax=Popillia japonica TaxID=7064 RepID=A0AAW1KM76_POPJA
MFNFFKGFFGPSDPRDDVPQNFGRREHFLRDEEGQFSRGFLDERDDHMGFNVFSNPLEMHRYFESQLNSMLKSFGIPGEGSIFGFNEGHSDSFPNFPEGPEQSQIPSTDELRDQYLKPGYQQPNSGGRDKSDSDLDGKINSSDLDSIFKDEPQTLQPYQPQPRIHTFGKQIMKTFTNHNGIIQSQQTIRDHEGNEEVIVTHKRGDQEYTKIMKTDKNGQQEIKENFINMNEEDLGKFFGGQNMIGGDSHSIPETKHPNWFPFNKYFK